LIHRDIFDGNEEFRRKLQEILQTRHVIVHNGGIIDEKAVKRVEKWNESMINKEIELHSDIVEGYLETIEKFAKQVHEKTAYI
jgi:hypothetical protein